MRTVGTVVRGIRTPIIKYGDKLDDIVIDSLLNASKHEKFKFHDRDVIGITEAVVAITQKNFITVDQLSKEIRKIFPDDVGVVFPILSRNRFSLILKAIAKASKKVHVLLSYPSDEVGNHLISPEAVDALHINPYTRLFEEKEFRKLFGKNLTHRFTGIDYTSAYKELGDGNIEIHFSNNPIDILKYTENVIAADIHTRFRTKKLLKENGAKLVYGLDEF